MMIKYRYAGGEADELVSTVIARLNGLLVIKRNRTDRRRLHKYILSE